MYQFNRIGRIPMLNQIFNYFEQDIVLAREQGVVPVQNHDIVLFQQQGIAPKLTHNATAQHMVLIFDSQGACAFTQKDSY